MADKPACTIMSDYSEVELLPLSVVIDSRWATNTELFEDTCLNWPQNTQEGEDLGDCCWEWV